jgi:alpha-ketoglutarate-dependent taurine dioxygenase
MEQPFSLARPDAYRRWRDARLAARPRRVADLLIEIRDPLALSEAERGAARERLARANLVLLQCRDPARLDQAALLRLGAQFGLRRLDDNPCADATAVSAIQVREPATGTEFIPYTERPLNWHTDGYYNAPDRPVRAWALLCIRNAPEGGENALLDHELAYIQLRDRDPGLIRALMAADAMGIPAHRDGDRELRPARSGPVFSIDPEDGRLQMRYSARRHHIRWRPDAATDAARAALERLFSPASAYIYRQRLEPGQCLLSNNVLHNRSGFRDNPQQPRLLYRARYHDRVRI